MENKTEEEIDDIVQMMKVNFGLMSPPPDTSTEEEEDDDECQHKFVKNETNELSCFLCGKMTRYQETELDETDELYCYFVPDTYIRKGQGVEHKEYSNLYHIHFYQKPSSNYNQTSIMDHRDNIVILANALREEVSAEDKDKINDQSLAATIKGLFYYDKIRVRGNVKYAVYSNILMTYVLDNEINYPFLDVIKLTNKVFEADIKVNHHNKAVKYCQFGYFLEKKIMTLKDTMKEYDFDIDVLDVIKKFNENYDVSLKKPNILYTIIYKSLVDTYGYKEAFNRMFRTTFKISKTLIAKVEKQMKAKKET